MRPFEAFILGIVEGVTEYLPISSTGHLILTSSLLGTSRRVDKASLDAFTIVIQGGAILAVVLLYRARVRQIVSGALGRDLIGRRLGANLVIAFVPAAVVGLSVGDTITEHLFFPLPVLAALSGGGAFMIAMEQWQQRRLDPSALAPTNISLERLAPTQALAIGVLQCAALWPGTSRSMVTILAGMVVGMRPGPAAEFSFLLGLPTLGAACAYTASKDLFGGGSSTFANVGPSSLLIGFVVAALSAALAVQWLVGFLSRRGLAWFGWYRIALAATLGLLMLAGLVRL